MSEKIIGVIIDWEKTGSFSDFPYFALRQHYIDAIILAGATPILIPTSDNKKIKHYLNMINGLLIPGGMYKFPDAWYVEENLKSPYAESPRVSFEKEFAKQALAKDLPVLGICAGMQVLAGISDCKLTGNLQSYFKTPLDHFDLNKEHLLKLNKESNLAKFLDLESFRANSHHQEAVVETNEKIRVAATTSDGCIEAIEIKNHKFALGLQWHPEMLCYKQEQINKPNPHHAIFKEFIKHC